MNPIPISTAVLVTACGLALIICGCYGSMLCVEQHNGNTWSCLRTSWVEPTHSALELAHQLELEAIRRQHRDSLREQRLRLVSDMSKRWNEAVSAQSLDHGRPCTARLRDLRIEADDMGAAR